MPSLTIKNIPDSTLKKLKCRAKSKRRSLNTEIVKTLEDLVTSSKIRSSLLIKKARKLREELNITIT